MARTVRWVLLACLVASCGNDDLTQLMVTIDTDFQVPGELEEVLISIRGPSGEDPSAESPLSAEELPLTLAVVHRGGPLGPVSVTVDGLGAVGDDGRRPIVIQRRATAWFVEGDVRELRLDLLRECRGVACAPDETCAEGGCRPRMVEENELRPWDGAMRTDFGVPDMGPDMSECEPTERCTGTDTDCDGNVDEGFDLNTDMLNCGRCGVECNPNPTRGSTTCQLGECMLACDDGFGDCDMDGSEWDTNGCEESLMTAAHCGSCGGACSTDSPICDIDTCVDTCPDGTDLCDGGTCADLQTSVSNCGTCGNDCPDGPNASPICTEGSCGLRCDMGFFNCDGDISNGCESRQRDVDNCGACGISCAVANAVSTCATGECAIESCSVGFTDCDGDPMNGCEANTAADPTTCGGCGTVCPADPANASPICNMGTCAIQCDPGYGNCDMNPGNGCEAFLGSPGSCNSCGVVCEDPTPLCSGTVGAFTCTGGCGAGETTCGMSCVDITTDVANCNGCGMRCVDPPSASPTCTAGTCGFTCDTGFDDCDTNAATGCETNITTVMNCGRCNNVCPTAPDAMIACVSGTCSISGCATDRRNCDGMYANGCETNITTSAAHCGGCGVACVPGMRVLNVGCTAGACEITECEPGYADCDGDFATGCEQRLGTRNHCSACNDRCMGGGTNRCCDFSCGSC